MKTITKIAIGVVAVVAVPLVTALFVDNNYAISREITINKPRQEVFSYVKHLKNQDHYSKWVMLDPAMKKDFRGTDGTVGFVYGWNGNDEAGEGEQEITNLVEGEKVEIEVRFKRPFEGIAYTPLVTEQISDSQTKVTWGMNGKHSYPLNFMNLFMDGVLGKDLETSLGTLKTLLEKQPVTHL